MHLFLAQATVYSSTHWLWNVFVYPCITSHACGINSLNTFAMAFNTITFNYQSQGCWCNSVFCTFVKCETQFQVEQRNFVSNLYEFTYNTHLHQRHKSLWRMSRIISNGNTFLINFRWKQLKHFDLNNKCWK